MASLPLFLRRRQDGIWCWDLEANKIIRHYHGHLSGVYTLSLHPTLDVLVTADRDASAQVRDMRTKAQIHVLSGHTATVADSGASSVLTRVTLAHHKKSDRAPALHPTEYLFVSGSAGGNNLEKWKCPEGAFVFNFSGHNTIIDMLSVNAEDPNLTTTLAADHGSLSFWDYNMEDVRQQGSLEAEAGVFCSTFDMIIMRLITGGADKTIKIYAKQSQ
ncbi:WD40-repeat-containing domain protein [Mycena sp. CBHHK59/15]|nr:WD40-repeat-containing domain protein [Mycena sp. CBHHK59/15]